MGVLIGFVVFVLIAFLMFLMFSFLLRVWAVHYIGADMLDLAKAMAGGDAQKLLGRRLRERIGGGLWRLSRCVLAFEEADIRKISCEMLETERSNAPWYEEDRAPTTDIEWVARGVLADMAPRAVSVSVHISGNLKNPAYGAAVKKAREVLSELILLMLANAALGSISKVYFRISGRIN